MRRRIAAAAGTVVFAAAVTIPAGPAMADAIRNDQWYLQTLHVSQAQAVTKGAGVTVAVVDSGTSPHPDLSKNLLPGTNVATGGSGDGRKDNLGHGTNMAAVIAAHGRGTNGVIGIAPAAKIMPVKVVNSRTDGVDDDIAKGIEWAVKSGAKVINASVGAGPGFAIDDAVADAKQADVIIVAASGNTTDSAVIDFPAAIDGVLTVGAIGRNGKHASFSLADPHVQICAPGEKIRTAQPENKYVEVDGTSPATAIVSGAAALVRAKFPQLSATEVIHRLTATADDIGPPGRDNDCGFGVLNIVKALTADVPPLGGVASPGSGASSSSPSVGDGYIDPAATTSPPRIEAAPSSGNTPLLVGGVLVGLVVAGGLVALLVVRRRRSF